MVERLKWTDGGGEDWRMVNGWRISIPGLESLKVSEWFVAFCQLQLRKCVQSVGISVRPECLLAIQRHTQTHAPKNA